MKTFECNTQEVLKSRGLEPKGEVQRYIDSKCLEYCEPKVPKDSNALIESGIINTDIGSGEIIYQTDYARRWYYMPANFQEAPERGNYWFERMKNEYKSSILAGAARIAGARPK